MNLLKNKLRRDYLHIYITLAYIKAIDTLLVSFDQGIIKFNRRIFSEATMSLANKFLRYFHRVHFGENKKHNLVPSHLPQNQSWLYRHLEQWNNIDWWVVVKGRGGDWEGLSGISPSYRVIAVECDMQMSHSEFVYSCQLALSSSLT